MYLKNKAAAPDPDLDLKKIEIQKGGWMQLVMWTCWYFAAVFLVNISLNAIAAATDLVKIKIVGKVG